MAVRSAEMASEVTGMSERLSRGRWERQTSAIRVISARAATAVPREAWFLWSLSALFLLRVVGQVLVEFSGVTFLPPSREWYSGLLPYSLLLPVQIGILLWMAWMNAGVTLRRGFFTRPHPWLGGFLLVFCVLYAGGMAIRYFVSGQLHPERRFWPPGSLPIVFHFVLAAYLYVLSRLAGRPVAAVES
jgi:hypothetical protein